MRIKNMLGALVSVSLILGGLAVIAVPLAGGLPTGSIPGSGTPSAEDSSGGEPGSGSGPEGFSVPEVRQPVAGQTGGPEDKTLEVTIPGMSRVENDTVPNAAGDDEQALKDNAAIHLKGTGFPWQEGANTYLAGHRLGYPGTDSFLAFWDLNELETGDEVYVEDSEGTEYTYRVYESFVTGPSDLSVTEPVEGKSVLTLQTCTLPNYTDRLIVRAELVDTSR